jgi:oxygen-independent coproporphyrinogen III oxidase
MFKKFSISGINALPRFGLENSSNISAESVRPISKSISLYIHIPFCKSICHFCMLRRGAKAVDSVPQIYIDNIIKDIELHKTNLQDVTVNSIYFGGGTPSMLSAVQFETLLKTIYKSYSVSDKVEITFEGEPQSLLNKELLSSLYNNNVSRVSFGLQTFDTKLRDLLGRSDSINDISNLFDMLSQYSFKEINIDYLYNLPNTDVEFIESEFKLIKAFNPSSIDCHPLKYISCSGHLLQNIVDSKMSLPTSELRIDMFNYIRNYLLSNNFQEQFADQYSIYSKTETNQYMCNLYGLDGGEYLGIGPGSRSHFGDYGFTNVQNLDNYFSILSSGNYPIQRITYAPMVDNYITCFPKRNDNLLVSDIQKSESSVFFLNQLDMLSEEGYVVKNDKSFSLISLGISWYQNLQEILLSPLQRLKHLENVTTRTKKFEKFGNYFENLGEVL